MRDRSEAKLLRHGFFLHFVSSCRRLKQTPSGRWGKHLTDNCVIPETTLPPPAQRSSAAAAAAAGQQACRQPHAEVCRLSLRSAVLDSLVLLHSAVRCPTFSQFFIPGVTNTIITNQQSIMDALCQNNESLKPPQIAEEGSTFLQDHAAAQMEINILSFYQLFPYLTLCDSLLLK